MKRTKRIKSKRSLRKKAVFVSAASAPRKSWDEYFMSIAELVANRSTCVRRNVGCVVVKDRRILATGYNGAPRGVKHCAEIGCIRGRMGVASGERHELCRGVHAEQNAIIQAATCGVDLRGSLVYTTHQPCFICTKMLINAQVSKIFFQKPYPDKLAVGMLRESGVKLIKYKK